ncbi:hypothetical protein [Streptomyces beijiangensis]|uniref:Uncharacterized protein n=1 Tax=Streptomyces beijiangensis TaxID=163361 RepID=A0A939FBL1_9ACTN|nr:hypothetical protein [Streptomyces beijiangensis]MBO0515246.1 hypothetical protein [Streptomyces beijiangensis]
MGAKRIDAWAAFAHVVPAELVADPLLGLLITPERARRILGLHTGTPHRGIFGPASAGGIGWLLDTLQGSDSYCITFARDTHPRELARRLGADTASVPPPPGASRARLHALFRDRDRPTVNVGPAHGDWSVAVENNSDRIDAGDSPLPGLTLWGQHSTAPARLACTAEDGEELWTLTVTADGPPNRPPGGLERGGLERGGSQPALLDDALTATGALDGDGRFTDVQNRLKSHRTLGPLTLRAVEAHFGLALRRERTARALRPVLDTPRRPKPQPSPNGQTLLFIRHRNARAPARSCDSVKVDNANHCPASPSVIHRVTIRVPAYIRSASQVRAVFPDIRAGIRVKRATGRHTGAVSSAKMVRAHAVEHGQRTTRQGR